MLFNSTPALDITMVIRTENDVKKDRIKIIFGKSCGHERAVRSSMTNLRGGTNKNIALL